MYKKTIELFLLDSNPNDRIICNISNWDGIGIKIPKTKLKESKERKELQNTGLYFLFSKNDDNDVYIGEAENVFDRLLQHMSEDTWNDALIFVKKDNNLNKAHVKYLENYFYNLAILTDRYSVRNSTIPTKSSISEADEAAMEEFAYYIKIITNTLGYKAFEKLVESELQTDDNYFIQSVGLHAEGKMTNEGFVVIKGSESNTTFKTASSKSLKRKWESLREENIVDSKGIFIKDYLFSSPSTAAAMILGRNANGLTEWKNQNKRALKEVLTSEVKN